MSRSTDIITLSRRVISHGGMFEASSDKKQLRQQPEVGPEGRQPKHGSYSLILKCSDNVKGGSDGFVLLFTLRRVLQR